MPKLSVLAVRLSLVYLLFGFSLGAILLANKGVPFAPWSWYLLPGHIDMLLFGFIIQLAMGMAYWILPRFRGGSRGNEAMVWILVILLNLGVWTIALTGWFKLSGQWLAAGRLLEGAAATLFAIQAWRRIRPF
jgi:hypothetical protein